MTPKEAIATRVASIPAEPEPLLERLPDCRRADTQSFADAWVGLEPTFSNRKTIRRWRKHARNSDEYGFFCDEKVLGKQERIARQIVASYRELRAEGHADCPFPEVERERSRDPYGLRRQDLRFHDGRGGPCLEVRISLDPETFEIPIKPVPLPWLYDERFVRFLQRFVWNEPRLARLYASMAHGGGQFCFSAKTFLQGSLLADSIAYRLNHPELVSWITDYPNPDSRGFRTTRKRFQAFRTALESYWKGAFHPAAIGQLTVENAILDRGFEPACDPDPGRMHGASGPVGDPREVFQTNFAFARHVRLRAQSVHAGYWQSQHPHEEGFRSDQVMRYGEANLNRVQIAGELHVKSGKVLGRALVADFDAPLDISMLHAEASWEQRSQMSKSSASDMVESVLLEAHHAAYLAQNPHVRVQDSLEQDRLLLDSERHVRRRAPKVLDRLRAEARRENLELSKGRVRSDWIEPEPLFWAAWHVLDGGERAAIAREAVAGFVERVEQAATKDPRGDSIDPMDAHRHRVHPFLWDALTQQSDALDGAPAVRRELKKFQDAREEHLGMRPPWSPADDEPPWRAPIGSLGPFSSR
jgi:hypothetical protein